MSKLLTFAILLWICGISHAANTTSPADRWRYSVGFGAGFESGNGVHLGLAQGKNAGQLGLGLIYKDLNAEFQYSTGFRFLRSLYRGKINDTYAWAGMAIHGHYNKEDEGFLAAEGAGVGLSLHLGMPFHLFLDSGWHLFLDSESKGREIQWGPTINGGLVYEW